MQLVLSDYFLRLRMINLFDLAFLERVLRPVVFLPHGDIGDGRPTGALP